jgi:hypothetical protein
MIWVGEVLVMSRMEGGGGQSVATLRTVCATEINAQAALLTLRTMGLGMVGLMILVCSSKGFSY